MNALSAIRNEMTEHSKFPAMHSHLRVVELTSLGLQALFAMYLYHYVTRLERIGCECSADRTRTYIQWYSLALFGVVVVKLALMLSGSEAAYTAFSTIMGPILLIASVIYVIYVIRYINRLKREKCACSATVSRTVIYVYAIIQAVMCAFLALTLLSIIIVLFMGTSKTRRDS